MPTETRTAITLALETMNAKIHLIRDETDHFVGNPIQDVDIDPRKFYARTFYPYTFPITVGPGGVAVMLTLSAHTTHGSLTDTAAVQAGTFVGVLGIAVAVFAAFAFSNQFARRLGPSGTMALMRLIAFIVVCIGAHISWTGIRTLVLSIHALDS